MGTGCSSPLPDLPNKDYMCVSTFATDSLLLLYAGKPEVEAIRNAVTSNWPKGIQNEHYKLEEDEKNPKHLNCLHFQLHGRPWCIIRDREQSIQCRLMATAIFKNLYNLGWKLLVSSDLSRQYDPSSWFFQKQVLPQDPYPMFSIGLSSTDKLQINDCPENLHEIVKDVAQSCWIRGIQSEDKDGRTYEIKLNGSPWDLVDKSESCSARLLLKEIIQKMSGQRYELYGNSSLSGQADTLFFNYNAALQGEEELLVVSLNRTDRLRLIKTPTDISNTIKETVAQHWPNGIQDIIEDENCFEIKLSGNPWKAIGQEAIYSRRLLTKIFESLASIGYFITNGLDMTRKENDKSVLIFRRGVPLVTQFMCVSLNEGDKIRFINAPQNIIEAGRSILHYWPLGLQEEKTQYDGVTYQAKMKGNPWTCMASGDGIHGRSILLGLLCQFNAMGWRLVCSADCSAKYVRRENQPDFPMDVHSWWFMYDQMLAQSCAPPPPGV